MWFATHFHELPTILADRLGVVSLHMHVEVLFQDLQSSMNVCLTMADE